MSLDTHGYILRSGILLKDEIAILRQTFEEAGVSDLLPEQEIGLADSDDKGNTVYKSTRSPGVSYAYLMTPEVMGVNRRVAYRLKQVTGHSWLTGLNRTCLPHFGYDEGAFIKAHRGRDIGYGANDLVAVAMITTPGVDFTGGEFYLNPEAKASDDGKTVWNDKPEDRILFPLEAGQVIIFNNNRFVHGTLPVRPGTDGSFRLTTSWRIAEGT